MKQMDGHADQWNQQQQQQTYKNHKAKQKKATHY